MRKDPGMHLVRRSFILIALPTLLLWAFTNLLGWLSPFISPAVVRADSSERTPAELQLFFTNNKYDVKHIWYLAVDGNDHRCKMDAASLPCQTWKAVQSKVRPGDAVVFRGGSYTETIGITVSGTPDHPTYFLAYPGERVVLNHHYAAIDMSAVKGHGVHDLVFDGLNVIAAAEKSNSGIRGNWLTNVIFRHFEVSGYYLNVVLAFGLSNVHLEDCHVHNSRGVHGIYIAGRPGSSNDRVYVDRCESDHNGYHGLQSNGPISGLYVRDSKFHDNDLGGIALLNGTHDSFILRNTMYGNKRACITLYQDSPREWGGGEAYNETNNLFEGNDCNVPVNSGEMPAVLVNDGTTTQQADYSRQTFEKNIFTTGNTAAFFFLEPKWATSWTVKENRICRKDGRSIVMKYGRESSGAVEYDIKGLNAFAPGYSVNVLACEQQSNR